MTEDEHWTHWSDQPPSLGERLSVAFATKELRENVLGVRDHLSLFDDYHKDIVGHLRLIEIFLMMVVALLSVIALKVH